MKRIFKYLTLTGLSAVMCLFMAVTATAQHRGGGGGGGTVVVSGPGSSVGLVTLLFLQAMVHDTAMSSTIRVHWFFMRTVLSDNNGKTGAISVLFVDTVSVRVKSM